MRLQDLDNGEIYILRKSARAPRSRHVCWQDTSLEIDGVKHDVKYNSNYGFTWYIRIDGQWFTTKTGDLQNRRARSQSSVVRGEKQ